MIWRSRIRSSAVAAGAVAAAGAGLAAQAPYPDAWDPAAVSAAEAAVARLGAKRSLDVRASVLAITGLPLSLSGGGTGVVATVQQVRQAMQDLGATETALEVRVDLPADVLFDFDKAIIRPDAAQALTRLATVIRAYPRGRTRLEGHTDSAGNDRYNDALSKRRADAVKAWLVQKEGLAAGRLEASGFGERRPVAANDTDEGRQKNRRVSALIRKS
jgi:outer membrane protein OmpA-like peptidoglycan-associated protein